MIQLTQLEYDNLLRLREENNRLRAALAQSELPCQYCSLSKEDWSKCEIGFPGCGRADDAMGCPELGAALALENMPTGEWKEYPENKPEEGKEYFLECVDGNDFINFIGFFEGMMFHGNLGIITDVKRFAEIRK